MSLFISYSEKDRDYIKSLYSILKQNGIKVNVSDYKFLNEKVWVDINNSIKNTDIALFFITELPIKESIIKEIMLAKKYNIDIIIIKDKYVSLPKNIKNDIFYVIDKDNIISSLETSQDYLIDASYKSKRLILGGIVLMISALTSLIDYKHKKKDDYNAI